MLDPLLGRIHRGKEYNCLHFADEAWMILTGQSLEARMHGSMRAIAVSFDRIDKPVSPCLVLMRRPKAEAHVGVYYRGRVAHLTERGARFEDQAIAALGFSDIRYYR